MTKYFEGEHLDEIRLARDNNMVELVYKRPGSDTDIARFHVSLLFPFIKEQLKRDNFEVKEKSWGYYRLTPAQIRGRFIDAQHYWQMVRDDQEEEKKYEEARY